MISITLLHTCSKVLSDTISCYKFIYLNQLKMAALVMDLHSNIVKYAPTLKDNVENNIVGYFLL